MAEETKLEHSDVILKGKIGTWLIVRESFKVDTTNTLKAGVIMRIQSKADNMVWCLDPDCNPYAIDRKDMWYLERYTPETD